MDTELWEEDIKWAKSLLDRKKQMHSQLTAVKNSREVNTKSSLTISELDENTEENSELEPYQHMPEKPEVSAMTSDTDIKIVPKGYIVMKDIMQ